MARSGHRVHFKSLFFVERLTIAKGLAAISS
jgi:hypothetical protein